MHYRLTQLSDQSIDGNIKSISSSILTYYGLKYKFSELDNKLIYDVTSYPETIEVTNIRNNLRVNLLSMGFNKTQLQIDYHNPSKVSPYGKIVLTIK